MAITSIGAAKMANEKKVQIEMVGAVVGENGKDWLAGTKHTASEPFAAELIRRGKAKPVKEK
jgi:hypothetical protein